MRHWLVRVALAAWLVGGIVVARAPAAHAQAAKSDTILTWQTPDGSLQPDQDTTVSVRLTTSAGAPLASQPLDWIIPGGIQRTVQTDENGVATVTFHVGVNEGTYPIGVAFRGGALYQPTLLSHSIAVVGSNNTRLTIEPLGDIPVGKNALITVQLTDVYGIPLAGEHVQLLVDGQPGESGVTDANGEAWLHVGLDISIGSHRIAAVYDGSHHYGPANANLDLGVNPEEIQVGTVPVLEGARFELGGKVYTTDSQGLARIPVDKAGTYQVRVLPYETGRNDTRADFAGWADQTFTEYHEVNVPSDGPIEAGFTLSYQVHQDYVDLEGNVVDPKRVTSMTFKRNDGVVYTFDSGAPRWLEGNYLVRRINGLVQSPYQYSLMSLVVNGTNVVSAQQQRFYVHPNDKWTLQLLLFGAQFRGHDTLFGFPLGSTIELVYPDGLKQAYPLDSNAAVQVRSLPRGNYQVSIKTRWGLSPDSSLAMSRTQDVDLPIVSWLDIGAVALVGFLFGPGLLYVGQPRFRRALHDGSIWTWIRHPRSLAGDN